MPLQVEDRYVNPTVVPGYLRNDFTRITPHEFLMQVAPRAARRAHRQGRDSRNAAYVDC